jgi:diacylglycerol kinase family enzyme
VDKVRVLINHAAGSVAGTALASLEQELTRAFAEKGITATIASVDPRDLSAAARAYVRDSTDAVVAVGGDGTINAVARELAGTAIPLGIIPLGTLNHFAKDLELPLALDAAVAVIAGGKRRSIDLGEVNGRIFLNNASVGYYPRLVREREQQRQKFGWRKGRAMIAAVARTCRRFPLQRVRLVIAGRTLVRTTPFVFVGNNAYNWNAQDFGRRSGLDGGHLYCYLPTRRGGMRVIARLSLAVLFGHLARSMDLAALPARHFRLHAHRFRLSVAVDGEVVHLAPPLSFRLHPRSLVVLVP